MVTLPPLTGIYCLYLAMAGMDKGIRDSKDIKLREKEAELARMQQMIEQMQQQLKMQNSAPKTTHQL